MKERAPEPTLLKEELLEFEQYINDLYDCRVSSS